MSTPPINREAAARLLVTEATVETRLLNDVNDRAAESYHRCLLGAPELP